MRVLLYLSLQVFAVWFCVLGTTEGDDTRSARQWTFPVDPYIYSYEDLQSKVLYPLNAAEMDPQLAELYQKILLCNQLQEYPYNEIKKGTLKTTLQEYKNYELNLKLEAAKNLYKMFGSKHNINQNKVKVEPQTATAKTLDFNMNTVTVLPEHLRKFFSELKKEVKRRQVKSYVSAQPEVRSIHYYDKVMKSFSHSQDITQNKNSALNEQYMRRDDISLEETDTDEKYNDMKEKLKKLTNEEVKELIIFFHKLLQVYNVKVTSETDQIVEYVKQHSKVVTNTENDSLEEIENEPTEENFQQGMFKYLQQSTITNIEEGNKSNTVQGTMETTTLFSDAKDDILVFESENFENDPSETNSQQDMLKNLQLPPIVEEDNTTTTTPGTISTTISFSDAKYNILVSDNENIRLSNNVIIYKTREIDNHTFKNNDDTTFTTTASMIKRIKANELLASGNIHPSNISEQNYFQNKTEESINYSSYSQASEHLKIGNTTTQNTTNLSQSTSEPIQTLINIEILNKESEEKMKLSRDPLEVSTITSSLTTESTESSYHTVSSVPSYDINYTTSSQKIMFNDSRNSVTSGGDLNHDLSISTTEEDSQLTAITVDKYTSKEEPLELSRKNNDATMIPLDATKWTSHEFDSTTTETVMKNNNEITTHTFESMLEEIAPSVE